jgi:acyl-ACP thioesterase
MRDYRILAENDRLLTTATTAWLVLDQATGRPKKMAANNNLHRFHIDDLHAIEPLPGKLPVIKEPDRQMPVSAKYSDLDINKHVNAVKYIEWVQDCYSQDLYERQNVKEFQINYQAETRFGEQVQINIRKASETDPFDYMEGIRASDANAAFRARIQFASYPFDT